MYSQIAISFSQHLPNFLKHYENLPCFGGTLVPKPLVQPQATGPQYFDSQTFIPYLMCGYHRLD